MTHQHGHHNMPARHEVRNTRGKAMLTVFVEVFGRVAGGVEANVTEKMVLMRTASVRVMFGKKTIHE